MARNTTDSIKQTFLNFIFNLRSLQLAATSWSFMPKPGGSVQSLIYGRAGNSQSLAVVRWTQLEQKRHGAFRPRLGFRIGTCRATKRTAQHLGIDHAGVQWDGSHPRRKFLSQRLREALDRPLGRAIRCDFGGGGPTPAGTEVHNHATFLLDHRGNEGANDVEHTFDVHIDHRIEFLWCEIPERRTAIN